MEQASALWTYIIGVAWNSHRSGVPYAITADELEKTVMGELAVAKVAE